MDTAQIEGLVSPLLEQEAVELVDLQFAREGPRWILRFFLDKEGGITLDDCAYLSERIGGLLDSGGALDRSYVLEVSSPGVDRVIKKDRDIERFSGRAVKLRLKAPEAGQRNFQGILRGLREGKVRLECGEETRYFSREAVAEIRLDEVVEL